ncbi:MAG TPA: VWA domain-containing protein [Gaiellaceae bacterium]|nr:VWA domain-containing protein [Gaiellaceae bacterium]
MSLGSPYLLLSLLALPVALGIYLVARRRRMRYAVRYTNVDVLAAVAGGREWRRHVAPVLFLVALATLCVAVTRPRVSSIVTSDKATVVLVLDISGSMRSTDVKPSRLAAAQKSIHLFLDRAPKRLKIGLVLFAAEPEVATPPTTDHTLVAQAVDAAGDFQGFGGTAIGDALAAAVRVGLQSVNGQRQPAAVTTPHANGLVSILFLSDGRQNRGVLKPLQGAARARDAGIPVYTVALGTNGASFNFSVPSQPGGYNGGFTMISPNGPFPSFAGLDPDPQTLRKIAKLTGGQFYRAKTAGAAENAYRRLGSSIGRSKGTTEVTSDFLAGALVLLILGGGISALTAPKLP